MISGKFDYHKPSTVAEAVALLKQADGDGLVLAGGHSLIPMMKTRLAAPACLVDITGIEMLNEIGISERGISIGALVTQHELIESEPLAKNCPILRETALQIADPQVRYCGTIGGNAANGDPGNDMPAVLQVLNASFTLSGPDGERRVAAREYYKGPFSTARTDNEILVGIHLPLPAVGHGYAYQKQKRKVGDYATAAAAVMLTIGQGRISSVSIALSNLADTPLLAEDAAASLESSAGNESNLRVASHKAAEICDPVSGLRGSAEFRRYLASVMVTRAVGRALSRARR